MATPLLSLLVVTESNPHRDMYIRLLLWAIVKVPPSFGPVECLYLLLYCHGLHPFALPYNYNDEYVYIAGTDTSDPASRESVDNVPEYSAFQGAGEWRHRYQSHATRHTRY